MSFLTPLLGSIGGAGAAAGAGGAAASALGSTSAARGLGHVIGVDPGRISSIADRIGKGANIAAAGGGADAGYAAPELSAPDVAPANHLQMLDPGVLQSIIARFRPGGSTY